jgi:hypothetical protein
MAALTELVIYEQEALVSDYLKPKLHEQVF